LEYQIKVSNGQSARLQARLNLPMGELNRREVSRSNINGGQYLDHEDFVTVLRSFLCSGGGLFLRLEDIVPKIPISLKSLSRANP
jgi:hypothetical protein